MPQQSTAARRPSIRTPSSDGRIEKLRLLVRASPQAPGVYRWLDADGKLLYVGKAKNLRKRLQSYLRASTRLDTVRGRDLRDRMAGLELTVTDTELEALVLEMHLIRSLKPRYNVLLTRDEHYVYVRISAETFPLVEVTEQKLSDGARYFGPFTNVRSQRSMLRLLRTLYPFRTCTMGMEIDARQELFAEPKPATLPLDLVFTRKDRRTPCLDWHIKQCAGPCTGEMTPEDYKAQCIDGVVAFYEGNRSAALEELLVRMRAESGERKFERAWELRSALWFIESSELQRKFFDPDGISADVLGTGDADGMLQIVLLRVRGGKIVGERTQRVERGGDPDGTATQFLVQHYDALPADTPDVLVLPPDYAERDLLRAWFSGRKRRIALDTPKRGIKQRLYDLARRNAGQKLAMA